MQLARLAAVALGLAALASFAVPPTTAPQDGKPPVLPPGAPDDLYRKPYRVGYPVYEPLRFVDLDDEPRNLTKEVVKQPLALVFFSIRDPLSRGYRARLEALAEKWAGRARVVVVAAHHDEVGRRGDEPWKIVKDYVEKEKPALEILIDKKNVIADDFKVLCANHAFVIGPDGYLRYSGGIDNDPHEKFTPESRTSYLDLAFEEILASKQLTHPLMRPQGRKLKRHPDSPPRTTEVGAAPAPAK